MILTSSRQTLKLFIYDYPVQLGLKTRGNSWQFNSETDFLAKLHDILPNQFRYFTRLFSSSAVAGRLEPSFILVGGDAGTPPEWRRLFLSPSRLPVRGVDLYGEMWEKIMSCQSKTKRNLRILQNYSFKFLLTPYWTTNTRIQSTILYSRPNYFPRSRLLKVTLKVKYLMSPMLLPTMGPVSSPSSCLSTVS